MFAIPSAIVSMNGESIGPPAPCARTRIIAADLGPLNKNSDMPIYEFKIAVRISVRYCERGDLNPHALRHRILSPARLPFRHSRVIAHVRDEGHQYRKF